MLPALNTHYQTPVMGERLLSSGTPDPNVVSWATRAFFKFGGRPNWYEPSSTPLGKIPRKFPEIYKKIDINQDFGYGAYNAPKITFSYSHDGFSLYLSRLLRPAWFENVTKAFADRRVNGTFMVTSKNPKK